ncbi:MAG: cysteine--tRNA ligase [Firmicutes bacterium]|nr:cysteine--tRNA ligase [Bacillota bacterium]
MQLYDTLTRRMQPLVPQHAGKVGIYVCGPTVYNWIHVGNARQLVVFDTLRRWLARTGYTLTYVQNITDVDDKIIARAQEENLPAEEVAERFLAAFLEDAAHLGVRPPDAMPRATQYIPQMIALIATLIEKGYAYAAGGDVYYRVRRFPEYGKLSGTRIEALASGARILPGEAKENPLDFALWKGAKPGEPSWESPWGAGRPGWHIECSTMSTALLGPTLDIHGGGMDLIFPHHENEIAQSEAAFGAPFARLWMHNGMVTLSGEKMAKSLGNVRTVHELLQRFSGDALRLFLLSAHYRTPLDFDEHSLEQSQAAVRRLKTTVQNLSFAASHAVQGEPAVAEAAKRCIRRLETAVSAALDEDLHTARAIAALFDAVHEANQLLQEGCGAEAAAQLVTALEDTAALLGLEGWAGQTEALPAEVDALVRERAQARMKREWSKADALRSRLSELGWTVEDTPLGPRVRRRA